MPEFLHTGSDKKRFVRGMFDDIAQRYDFLNHFLSFGIDFYWRNRLVNALPKELSKPVLDVATGTGDVGILISKKRPESVVIGLDYAYKMTRLCAQKISRKNVNNFSVLQGDGENLPFANHSFSAITIAFGFRNIGHYREALTEFNRVLVDGGRLLILEFAEPESWLFRKLYNFYFRRILPLIGSIFSKSYAYRYLPESVENFPSRIDLCEMLSASDFKNVGIRNFTFGAVTLIQATKAAKSDQ